MAKLLFLLKAAANARKPALLRKAVDGIKELAEKTGLEVFKTTLQEFSKRNIEIERMMEQIKVKEN